MELAKAFVGLCKPEMPEIAVSWIPLEPGKRFCLRFNAAQSWFPTVITIRRKVYWWLSQNNSTFSLFIVDSLWIVFSTFPFCFERPAGLVKSHSPWLSISLRLHSETLVHIHVSSLYAHKRCCFKDQFVWNYPVMSLFFLWEGHKALHYPLYREGIFICIYIIYIIQQE